MTKVTNSDIPPPSVALVQAYAKKWETLDQYVAQERSLEKLFTATYPKNDHLDEVLIKVSALNDFYSTRIRVSYETAKHIFDLSIDQRLGDKDLTLVNEIAFVNGRRSRFSFATKYCSHHLPDVYPIYDGFVVDMLMHFKKMNRRFAQIKFTKAGLKSDYLEFHRVIRCFMDHYELNDCSLKDIDRYLWLSGKGVLPDE